jgi:hypothetical protein
MQAIPEPVIITFAQDELLVRCAVTQTTSIITAD